LIIPSNKVKEIIKFKAESLMEGKKLSEKSYLGGKRLKFQSNKNLKTIFIITLMPLSKVKTTDYPQIINFINT